MKYIFEDLNENKVLNYENIKEVNKQFYFN